MTDTGTVIIAVAGVAGTIGGGVLGAVIAGRTQAHNLRRQLTFQGRQDRRRVYAAALCSLDATWTARASNERLPSAINDADYRLKLTETGMAVSEVRLVGPTPVGSMALNALRALAKPSESDEGELAVQHAALLSAMRKDLGEDPDSPSELPWLGVMAAPKSAGSRGLPDEPVGSTG